MKKKYKSVLFANKVVHKRFLPFENIFKYSVTSLYIDYDEILSLDKNIKFFSYNKFNVFSFNEIDHGYRDNRTLKEFAKDILFKNSIKFNELKLKILCFPRIIGYVFNPLSIIFCFDKKNLIAIFYEVKNTSMEQHTYCFINSKKIIKEVYKHKCKKKFYVSPFIEMNCYYIFQTKIPDSNLSLYIEEFNKNDQKILFASQIGEKNDFSSATILKSFFINPLMTFRIILGIHYEAMKIFFKGGRFYSRVKKPVDTISFEGKL